MYYHTVFYRPSSWGYELPHSFLWPSSWGYLHPHILVLPLELGFWTPTQVSVAPQVGVMDFRTVLCATLLIGGHYRGGLSDTEACGHST